MNGNDEARMTNDEGMTKSEAQKAGSGDDSVSKKDFLKTSERAERERAKAASTQAVNGSPRS